MVNKGHIVEGALKENTSSQENDSPIGKLEISKAFGKKSKTWTSFYDSEDYSIHFQPKTELHSKTTIDVHKGSEMDKTEETSGSYFGKDVQGECSNLTGDVCSISSADQSQWKPTDNLPDCPDFANEQPGPSNVNQRQKARNKHQTLLHAQMARERLWKYHKNCCDEYQPCQTASKVLKQIKALEKTQLMPTTQQCPPSDEDLLEENPSLPPLPISSSKDHTLGNQAIFSKMTCASLPNLSQYNNHKVCAFHDNLPLISPLQASVHGDDNSAGSDQPGIYLAHSEHLKNVTSCDINLPVLQDPAKSSVRSEKEMNTVSSRTLTLPMIDSPAVAVVEGNTYLDDRSVSQLALPVINGQTDNIESKIVNHLSASPVELPTICEPLLDVAVQVTNYENMTTSDLYSPVVSTTEQSALKILEESDNDRDSQSVVREILNNKINAIPDPGIAGKPSLESQSLQLHLEIKTQISRIKNEPDVNGVCANEESNMAAIRSPGLPHFIEMIHSYGEVIAGDNESTQTKELPKHTEFSNESLDTQTYLTSSVAYSNSIQDGEEVFDWPKMADLVKHSSTISLSSNFDILNHTLVPHSTPKNEHECDTSNMSNTDLHDDKSEKAETMYNHSGHIDDHEISAVEGLSFNCTVLQQNDMETEGRKSLSDIQNEMFHIQDGTPSLEKEITILHAQGITEGQSDMSVCYLEYSKKANLEEVKGIYSYINSDNIHHTSHEDSIQTSNLDMVVDGSHGIHKTSEQPYRDQTGHTIYANDKTVNHEGHQVTTPVNNRHSGKYKGQQDLLKDLVCYPDAKIQTSEAEYPQSQIDIRNDGDLGTVITDEAAGFKGYDKLNVKGNSNVGMVDINNIDGHFEGISNLFQDILRSDSTAASKKIGTLAESKRRESLNAETSSDRLKTNDESDDSSGSEYRQRESDCKFDGSVNALRKASEDTENLNTVNSGATFNNGQASGAGEMNISLCNAEIPLKMNQQLLDTQNVLKTYSKQANYQMPQINGQLKATNNVPPANVKNELTDYLSSRIYRRPFYSIFPFSAKTPNTEENEMVKSSTLGGKPSASDSDTTRPSLVFSDRYNENTKMEAVEYLTYLYARSLKPKPCSGSLEGLKDVRDMDDISVLANLNFCKVALPGKITKPEMSTDVQELYVDSNLEPEHVYVPPNKAELETDDELALLHVMCTLKKSLELFPNSETEAD